MPSHEVHDTVTMLVSPLAGGITAVALNPSMGIEGVAIGVCLALGGLSNLLLTPDLDQAEGWGCYSFYRMQRVSPLIGAIWRGYWFAYGKLCKHRGLSHTPVIGTLGRVLYALPWLAPMVLVALLYWPAALAWLVGLMWADAWHTFADVVERTLG